jgi:arginyl-tRNA synthetase
VFEQDLAVVAAQIKSAFAELGLPDAGEIRWQPTPFAGQWGVGTNVCFQVAAAEARAAGGKKVSVPQRAQELAKAIAEKLTLPSGFARLAADKAYLNAYFDTPTYAARVVSAVLEAGEGFGRGEPKSERVMVEYSQPNTHKAFHVGHLRNVILGSAMCNILEFAGFDTVRANYIGDIGLHVMKWLWCYMTFHSGEEPATDRTRWMGDVYAEADRLFEDPENEQAVRALFRRWDRRDPDLVALWEKTRQWSLEGFAENYKTLGVQFDHYFYESEVEEPGKELVKELIAKGLATDERPAGGAVFVNLDRVLGLEKEQYRVLVILRSDGTSLYSTKDIPLAIKKFMEWRIDRSIYVIDVRQSLYMQQLYKILELMGFAQAQKCFHLSYEIVSLPGNVAMSSREGTVVLFEDLVREAVKRAAEAVQDKNPDLTSEQKEIVARAIGLGSIKYPMLCVDNNKVVTFDWESAVSFDGKSAPYIQNAHVRANSILRKAGGVPREGRFDYALHPLEVELIELISRFPATVQSAANDYKPLHMANYAYELAKTFHSFYHEAPVLQAESENIRSARLRLTAAVRQTLANALRLLVIQAPEVM